MRSFASLMIAAALALAAAPAAAQDAPKDIKGLFLLTDYPAVTVRPGTAASVSLRLQNYGLPPERLSLEELFVELTATTGQAA